MKPLPLKILLSSIAYKTFRKHNKIRIYRTGMCNQCSHVTAYWFCSNICEQDFRNALGRQFDLRLENYP